MPEAAAEEEEDQVIIQALSGTSQLFQFEVPRGTHGRVVRATIAETLGIEASLLNIAVLDKHFFLVDEYKVMEDLRLGIASRIRGG